MFSIHWGKWVRVSGCRDRTVPKSCTESAMTLGARPPEIWPDCQHHRMQGIFGCALMDCLQGRNHLRGNPNGIYRFVGASPMARLTDKS